VVINNKNILIVGSFIVLNTVFKKKILFTVKRQPFYSLYFPLIPLSFSFFCHGIYKYLPKLLHLHKICDLKFTIINMTSFTTDPNTDLFYSKAKDYWAGIDATLNGVLGGYGFIADADARGSNNFLIRILKVRNECSVHIYNIYIMRCCLLPLKNFHKLPFILTMRK